MGELAALLSAITWSATSVVLTSLTVRVRPLVVSALRLALASLLLPVALILAGQLGDLWTLSLITILGIAGSGILAYAIGDTIYIEALKVVGMQRTFPTTMALYIALTVAGGILVLDEPFEWTLVAGAALICAGIALLVAGPRPENGARGRPDSRGLLLLTAVGVFWAAATIWLAHAAEGVGALPANTVRAVTSGAVVLGAAAAVDRRALLIPLRHRTDRYAILVAGLMGTFVGSILYVYAVVEAGAARTATLSATSPLMALPLSVVFLHEPLTRRVLAGTGACVLGIVLVVA
jgi:drug/metabolite transporter (DMT)-like permease